jgi:uncharacterized membrane protein (UPF0127 family)
MKAVIENYIIADDVKIADTFMTRFVGLMNKKSINEGEGLLLMRCSSIHCFFMKFTIDAVYLSKDMIVLDKETVAPWKIGIFVKRAAHVLELSENASKRISPGDKLEFI